MTRKEKDSDDMISEHFFGTFDENKSNNIEDKRVVKNIPPAIEKNKTIEGK